MKVLRNTDAVLVLEHRPLGMALLVQGMGALTAGAAAMSDDPGIGRLVGVGFGLGLIVLGWWAFPLTRTVFHRDEGLVVHEERRLTGRRIMPRPLADITGARVQATWSDNTRTTRLILETTDGPMPLERGSGNADRRAAETAVNEWLTRPV